MTLAFADISNHQPTSWRPTKAEKVVFVLATDGHSWESPDHDDQVKLLRSLKRRVGHYHWLRPGNIQAQVDWFWDHAKPKPGDAVILDWEQAGTSNADKDQFLQLLDGKIPRTKILKRRRNQRLLYCNENYWYNYDRTSFVGEGLWIARYGGDPSIQFPWTLHQYTDKPYDRSHSIFATLAEYDAWSNPRDVVGPAPVAPPAATVVQVFPSLDKIRTPFGQWGTSWSWNWNGKQGQHGGDDWHRNAGMAEIGDPIYAVADGEIIYAGDARKDGGQGWGSAFGIHTLLKWDTGGRTSVDGHMSKLHVKTGQKVKAGDVIGEKGMTGNVSGPHVHHEDHLGTKWTDKRVKPIYPGIKTTQPVPAPAPAPKEDDLIMADPEAFNRSKDQVFAKSNTWQTLKVDDKNDHRYRIEAGPGTIEALSIIETDTPLYASFAVYDWKTGTKKLVTRWPHVLIPAGGGSVHFYDKIGGPGKGYTSRVIYLEVDAFDGATVSRVNTHVGKV